MELTLEQLGDIAVVKLPVDHLDASNCEEFETPLLGVIDQHSKVILDLSRVEFIDSSGVGVLLFCVRKSDNQGGQISICNPTESVAMAFDLVRMHRLCAVTGSPEESAAGFCA